MNVQGATAILLYVIAVSMLGFCALRAAGSGSLRTWGMCYIAGQLVALFITLAAGMAGIPLAAAVSASAVVGGGTWVYMQVTRGAEMRAFIRSFFLAIALGLLFPMAWAVTFAEPLWEWDARSIWFFHAKAMFFDNGFAGALLEDHVSAWTHPDYPLLVPTQAAWIGVLLGEWDETVVKSFLFFNFLAYVQVFFEQGRRLTQPAWLLLPLTVFLFDLHTAGYVNGMADNHYSVCLVLALLAAARAEERHERADGDVVLLLGAAAATKNEGMVFALVLVLLLIVIDIRSSIPRFASRPRNLLVTGFLALAPVLAWQAYKAVHGIGNDLGQAVRAAHITEIPGQVVSRCGVVVKYLWANTGDWVVLAPAAMLVLFTILRVIAGARSDRRLRLGRVEWAAWSLLLVAGFLVFGVYLLTPRDVRWHMGASLTRVMFFPRLLLQAMLVLSLEAFLFRRAMEAPE